jgi:putative spermidine/putrescine transport system permease protein
MSAPPKQRQVANVLYRYPNLLLLLLLGLPILWFGGVYFGSLLTLLLQSFFHLDDFTGQVVHELTVSTYRDLFTAANLRIMQRTVTMAIAVSLATIVLALPLAYYMARYASPPVKAALYLAVVLPLWANYLVRVYAWKLILAKEGVLNWLIHLLHLDGLLQALLSLPGIGGSSLSVSSIGMFLAFVYLWLPYMILPMEAALERVPPSLMEASADLGGKPWQTFRHVLFPLAFPGVVAGSIFTFSLTLGDFITPSVLGNSSPFIGQAVYVQQGTARNVPGMCLWQRPSPLCPLRLCWCTWLGQSDWGLSMHSNQAGIGLKLAVAGVLFFLYFPFAIILLYTFTTEDSAYTFPPPGLTLNWFPVSWHRSDLWQALGVSLQVASIATVISLVLGTMAAVAVYRSRFFGQETISFLLLLPIALPGIATGIALRSAIDLLGIPFSIWTIVVGHFWF